MPRRTKEWWAALTAEERSSLVYLERAEKRSGGYSAYLPDDCRECGGCSQPVMSGSLCNHCWDRLDSIIAKANAAVAKGSV